MIRTLSEQLVGTRRSLEPLIDTVKPSKMISRNSPVQSKPSRSMTRRMVLREGEDKPLLKLPWRRLIKTKPKLASNGMMLAIMLRRPSGITQLP